MNTLAVSNMLYVGIDIGKASHYAGFVSTNLLTRYRRFESCPNLSFAQSRTGFVQLVQRMQEYAPLDQCIVLLERTGHYHLLLKQYLQEQGVMLYEMHVQKRENRDKTDKRDSLSLANHLYNQLEKSVQFSESTKLARLVHPPTETAIFLRSLVKHREELIWESTQRKNKLTSICDELFPELTTIMKNPNSQTALNVREKYATAADVASATIDDLLACRVSYRLVDIHMEALRALAVSSIGTRDPGRLRSLTMQQRQMIAELRLLTTHIAEIEQEIIATLETSREGQILTSLPVIGPTQAAILLALIGNIHNFSRPAQLKSYCGWSPRHEQTGTSVNVVKLTPGGNPVLKRTMYLVAMNAVRLDTEWRDLYQRLVPVKCKFDERKGVYYGRMKVIGRVAGQIITLVYTLLKKDATLLASLAEGEQAPPPVLYDRVVHHAHRAGSYRRADTLPLGSPPPLVEKLHNE